MTRHSLTLVFAVGCASFASAQTFGPSFAGSYSIRDLGAPANVPVPLGGVTLLDGDLDTLLIGGAANSSNGAIYRAGVQRDSTGHIVAFLGAQTLHSTAPFIDGGLAYGPDGVLCYVTFPNNQLGQIRPGSVAPDKVITLTTVGICCTPGGMVFVPPGFAGAGQLKIQSWGTAQWWDTSMSPDGSGTFNLAPAVLAGASLATGPESAVYIAAGNPGFTVDAVLVPEYNAGRVSAYDIDAGGNPIIASRRDFITGLSGAEGALVDPLTGDFLFSTFGGGNRVLVVGGFAATSTYCQSKTSSNGCAPTIGSIGTPTLSGPDDLRLLGSNLTNRRNAILAWSLSPASTPFAGGTLCLAAPLMRMSPVNTGGSLLSALDCSGTVDVPFTHAFMNANALAAGATVYAQILVRDPGFTPPDTLSLTAGLRFTVAN